MDDDLALRRKWAFKAHDQMVVLVKKAYEKRSHVMMKALLWALYLPVYPDMFIEGSFKGRYKPDVVALDSQGNPRFWGEAGRLGLNKIRFLARKYRTTHFAISKWDQPLKPYLKIIENAAAGLKRTRPVDLIRFSSDSPERFIDREGQIHISQSDIEWIRIL